MSETTNPVTAEKEDTRVETANNEPSDPATEPPESGERTAPDLENLLAETADLVANHETRVSEVESKVKELRDAMAKLELWRDKRTSRLEAINKIANPFDGLNSGNRFSPELLEKLTTVRVITAEKASQLQKLYELIDKLSEIKNPTEELKDRLAKLESVEKELSAKINGDLASAGAAFEERRRFVREKKILDHCNKRTGLYGQKVKTLESDPLVKEKMEKDAFTAEVRRSVQSIATRLKIALDNLAKALGDENFSDRLMKTLDLEGNAQRMHVYNLQADLTSAVRSGAIANPGNVVPWKSKTGRKYLEIMRSLTNRELMQKVKATGDEDLMKRMDNIFDTEDCLRRVFGREYDGMGTDRNGKPVKKQKSEFWRAFEQKESK